MPLRVVVPRGTVYVLFALLRTSTAFTCQTVNDSFCTSSGYTANTTFPNVFNQTEQEAKDAVDGLFYLSFLRCSSRINQFLCSAFYPACNPFFPLSPIEPCLEFCVQVRDECLPLLRSFGLSWPIMLNCDKHFTSIEKNSLCSLVLPTDQPAVNQSNSTCTSAVQLFTKRTFIVAWVATCTLIYVGSTAIIVLFFCCTRTFNSIESAITSIASCYALAAVAYCVSVATASNRPACSGLASLPEEPVVYKNNSLCIAMFSVTYYFTFCTWTWWVALTLQWLARGLDTRFSRQKRILLLCHLFSWLVPTPFLAACVVRQDLVFDPVMGVCSINKDGFPAYLIIPLFIILALCCIVTLLAHILLLRHKVQVKTKSPPHEESNALVLRTGIYNPLYFLVQSSLLLLYSYDYWYISALSNMQDTASIKLHVNIAKFTVPIAINIMTLAWVCTKTSCCKCHRTRTVDFLNCDLPTLSQTDTLGSLKETSV